MGCVAKKIGFGKFFFFEVSYVFFSLFWEGGWVTVGIEIGFVFGRCKGVWLNIGFVVGVFGYSGRRARS